jgi:hypothetical protein
VSESAFNSRLTMQHRSVAKGIGSSLTAAWPSVASCTVFVIVQDIDVVVMYRHGVAALRRHALLAFSSANSSMHGLLEDEDEYSTTRAHGRA